MKSLQNFFLFCSGANQSILKKTPIEINKYVGIGATIFFTGLLAAIAAGYAAHTIFNNTTISVTSGLIWGLMIFNLDRLIVSTMIKKDSFTSNLIMATPRILLALLIAVVIAKPLELKIFQSEIESELVQMEQETFRDQDILVQSRYLNQIDTLSNEIAVWKNEIQEKVTKRNTLIAEANAEADGTGGSGLKNLGPIYKVKKDAADLAQIELDQTNLRNTELIGTNEGQIAIIRQGLQNEIDQLKRVSLTGFAARLEGLERAANKSSAINMAVLFITLLFMVIELAPIITKLMMERGPYDLVIENHKLQYDENYKVRNNLVFETINSKLKYNSTTSEHRLKEMIKAEKELTDLALNRKIEDLKNQNNLWEQSMGKGSIIDF